MVCTTCGGAGSSSGGSGCCNLKAMDVVTPLDSIRNGDANFCFEEITDQICENLKNDEGIHPSATHSNTDCDDLSSLNDLATGSLHNALMTLNFCDVDAYKCWLDSLLSWQWNVDKAIICAICGLWKIVHCLDEKTQQSVQTADLWEGSQNIFSLPTLTLSQNLSNFTYLDLHVLLGTEHQVIRISLEGGLGGIPTAVHMDKTGGNSDYSIADGAVIAKELGIAFPSANTVKIDHFIWSLDGSSTPALNVATPGVHIAFSSTAETKLYCDSQDTANDKPHTLLKIEGIISRQTASCM